MWKKLLAAVAGLGLASGTSRAGDPAFPNSGVFAVEQPAGVAQPSQGSRVLSALRWTRPTTSGPSSLEEEGFRGSVFSTRSYPSVNREITQAGGQEPKLEPKLTKLPDIPHTSNPMPGGAPTSKPAAGGMPPGAIALADGSVLVPKGTTPEGEPIYEAIPASRVRIPEPAKPSWRVWGSAEVLLGMTRRVNVPPVVTTGPAILGPGIAGAIGQPGTAPLFGGHGMLDDWRAGFRTELGAWFDDRQRWGAEARFYTLFSTSDQFAGGGNGTNVVNLPHFLPVGPVSIQYPLYVSFPGATSGSASSTSQTTFVGGDLSLRRTLMQTPATRVDLLFGYRQLHVGDELATEFNVTSPLLAGSGSTNLLGGDSVRSRNNFYGGNIGVVGTYNWKIFSIESLTAVSLGVNVSDVDFDIVRQVAVGGVPSIPLQQSSSRDRNTYFGVVAESGMKLGVNITRHAKLTFGYTGLFWNNLRRAPDQYTGGPALTGNTTYLYAHMLSWGAEFRY